MNRSFETISNITPIKNIQWPTIPIRSSRYTNKNIQFAQLLVKLQSQDKWYIGIVHVLFISLEEELKSTNQIRSILLGARDRRKKDEASQYRSVIESPFFFFLFFFFSLFQSLVSYPQTVCLPGSLSFACSLEHHSSIGRAIRLATFCIERTVSSASRIHLFAVSPLLADRELISFDVVIHLSRERLPSKRWLYNTNVVFGLAKEKTFPHRMIRIIIYFNSSLRLFLVYLKLIIGEKIVIGIKIYGKNFFFYFILLELTRK